MHIELSELLRCPEPHEQTFCVVSPDELEDRIVVSGLIGCPTCRNEYEIRNGAAFFTTDDSAITIPSDTSDIGTDAPTLQALLNITGPGGNVALVGTAAVLAPDLAQLVNGVHFVACNGPESVQASHGVSVLYAPGAMPLRTSSMRGVVLGAEMAHSPWIEEAVRVILRGTRFVAMGLPECPSGIKQLAAGDGIVVGERV